MAYLLCGGGGAGERVMPFQQYFSHKTTLGYPILGAISNKRFTRLQISGNLSTSNRHRWHFVPVTTLPIQVSNPFAVSWNSATVILSVWALL